MRSRVAAILVGIVLAPVFWHTSGMCATAAPRTLDRIAAGTVVPDGPPKGWTHLIFKTHCRLASGDIDSLPGFGRSLAEFLFTAMVAQVAPVQDAAGRSFRLEKVAIGVGTRIGQADVIISSQTQKELGANLGMFKVTILGRAEEQLDKIRQVAASDTMMVVDAPTVMETEGQHRIVILRYLFLVEPRSGQLATVVWRIDVDARGVYRPVNGPAVLVQPNVVATSPLHVDSRKFFWGVPGAEAFAVTRLPPGTAFRIPLAAKDLVGWQELSADAAGQLESHFRQVIQFR